MSDTTKDWLQHVEKWQSCQRCPLAQQRGNICLARGTLPCDVLFCGEAPGMSEDALGQPFMGPAGHLMDQIIRRALETHSNVTYVLTNLVACFPREAKQRGDNEPERGEIYECRPRLIEFVNIARPRLIVTVGDLAGQYSQFDSSIPFLSIVHPAYILARLPTAQKGMAANKCAVQIRTAVERMLESPVTEWKPWGEKYAQVTPTREQLRSIYTSADGTEHSEGDIPY